MAVPWFAVAAFGAVAWAVTVMLARKMGNGSGTMGLALLPFLGLWVVMMAAMMLPSVAPVAVLWTRLISGASAIAGRALRMSLFLAGYLLTWAAVGVVAFAALAGTGRLLVASPVAANWLGVAIFIGAGVYQLTPGRAGACAVAGHRSARCCRIGTSSCGRLPAIIRAHMMSGSEMLAMGCRRGRVHR